jgi:hypothetical protein
VSLETPFKGLAPDQISPAAAWLGYLARPMPWRGVTRRRRVTGRQFPARARREYARPGRGGSHAHFSRILAATAPGLTAGGGHLFASATASVAVVRVCHGERCIGLWDATADLVTDVIARAQLTTPPHAP